MDPRYALRPEEQSILSELAGTHPFFLQAACHFLFSGYAQGLDPTTRRLSLRKEYFEEAVTAFLQLLARLADHEKILLTTLALLARQGKTTQRSFSVDRLRSLYNRSEQTLTGLEKRGLLKLVQEQYALFCLPFGDWIVQEITNTMNDQQPYEDWLKSNQGAMERLSPRCPHPGDAKSYPKSVQNTATSSSNGPAIPKTCWRSLHW